MGARPTPRHKPSKIKKFYGDERGERGLRIGREMEITLQYFKERMFYIEGSFANRFYVETV